MPRPLHRAQRYVPGLDGLRAVAVLCVIAYHVNLPFAPGGMLGVGVFFTLSGYLITDLLLTRLRVSGNLGLKEFWLRRARRLLPALFVMLALVSVWVALFDASVLHSVRGQVAAAAVYISNWYTIAQNGSYFARFAAPLPLDHLWSLAIEEQFYLFWPWLLGIGMLLSRHRLPRVALGTLLLALLSAVLMGALYHPGYDPTRVYEGTDTRAFGLLIGAALAMVWGSRAPGFGARVAVRRLLDATGVLGLVGIVVLVWRTGSLSPFLYPEGFLLLAVASAAVVAAVVHPGSRLGRWLGWWPLRWVGVRSYGIYLWQWPIIVLASGGTSTFVWWRALPEVAATFVVAAASWRWVEEPIRRAGFRVAWSRVRDVLPKLGPAPRLSRRLPGLVAAAALLLVLVSLGGGLPVLSLRSGSAGASAMRLRRTAAPLGAAAAKGRPGASTRSLPRRSSCRSVDYIGDSTSEGETSSDYIPNPRQRLQAQLARVGVHKVYPDISGARSIVETFQGHPNAATVAQQHINSGFRGCWILALGTNDVDNVHDGATIGFSARIARMMKVIGDQPVMWVDVVTLLPPDNPYAEDAMQRWNRALLESCPRYPNMRVFDWASWAKPRWFIPDGIHYYTPGYIARTKRIAQGLAHAFPRAGSTAGTCVVR